MKRIEYILLLAVLLLVSCTKEQMPTNDNEGKLPISYGYMQFGTSVSTRSHLAESLRGKDFGVIGFKYSETSNWETSKSTAAPGDWFHNVKVSCDDSGICDYGTPQPWEDYNYAFFAYHPYKGAGISLSDSSATNTPMLTYKYGWLNQAGSISTYDSNSPVFDLMTAEALDVNGSGSGRVDLDFKHRMFALEVLANNYNESESGNDAAQYISSLTLTLVGLTNTQMTIPLSMMSDEPDPIYTKGTVGTRTFKISDEKIRIPAFNETIEYTFNGEKEICGAGVATSISKYGSKNGGYVFLIPQEGTDTGVKGTLNWTELEYFQGGANEVQNTFESTITFEPGILYQIHINFVGSGITIALIEAGNWESTPDVEHTFE